MGVSLMFYPPFLCSFCVLANQGANCQVLLDNGQGSSLVLQLPCDAQTAVFITQLKKALYQFSKSPVWVKNGGFCMHYNTVKDLIC